MAASLLHMTQVTESNDIYCISNHAITTSYNFENIQLSFYYFIILTNKTS
ncbi:MAG: hypothetical protein FD177_1602 [Desulfovibrionaceae bacterium]|nr:MAG: hypothetical protein FD177_1602 [Desulfovibrionaceae bacterium]